MARPGATSLLSFLRPVSSDRGTWSTLPLLHHGQLTPPASMSPPSVPDAAGRSGGPAGGLHPGTERVALLPLSVPAWTRRADQTSPAPAGPCGLSQNPTATIEGGPRRPPRNYPHGEPGERRHQGSRAHAPRISPGFGLRGSASAPRICRRASAAASRVRAWLRRGIRSSLPCAFSLGCFSLLKNTVIKEDP